MHDRKCIILAYYNLNVLNVKAQPLEFIAPCGILNIKDPLVN